MSNSTEPTINSIKKTIPISLIIASIISITLVTIIIFFVIAFFICRRIRENSIRNPQIFVEEQNKKNENNNIKNNQNLNFKQIPNSSVISSEIRQNMSLVEIKEKNLKEQIHNIIHGSNVNKSMDGIEKKKKRKNGKKSTRSNTKSDEGNNSSIKISEEIEKNENKVNTIEHV